MNMLGPVLKTNSLISLCLSVWMCLFFIPLSPHSLHNPVIFVFFSPITLPAVFSLLLYLGSVVFIFSPLTFSLPLLCHFLSLSFRPASLPPLSFTSFTPSVSLTAAAKNKADFVLRDESSTKPEISLSIWLSFGCFRNFLYFGWKKLFGCQRFPPNTQWIVLILPNFRFIHLRQAW